MPPSDGPESLLTEEAAASTLQRSILPAPAEVALLEERFGLAVTCRFEPIAGAGGDIWGMKALGGDVLAVYLADFTGHGPPAAANTIRLHTLMVELFACGHGGDAGAILGAINRDLAATLETGDYATMLYGVVNTASGTFDYAAAAAPRPIVAERGGRRVHSGDGSGLPLGISADVRYGNRHLPFPPDSFLLLHSDALIEGQSERDRGPGKERVVEMARQAAAGPFDVMDVDTLIARFLGTAERPLRDDLTVLCCHRLPPVARQGG